MEDKQIGKDLIKTLDNEILKLYFRLNMPLPSLSPHISTALLEAGIEISKHVNSNKIIKGLTKEQSDDVNRLLLNYAKNLMEVARISHIQQSAIFENIKQAQDNMKIEDIFKEKKEEV